MSFFEEVLYNLPVAAPTLGPARQGRLRGKTRKKPGDYPSYRTNRQNTRNNGRLRDKPQPKTITQYLREKRRGRVWTTS